MDTLDKLVALIREFAEKASVPAMEAARAVVAAVGWTCVGNAVVVALAFFLAATIVLVSLRYAFTFRVESRAGEYEKGLLSKTGHQRSYSEDCVVSALYLPRNIAYGIAGCMGVATVVLFIVSAAGAGDTLACIAEPLGYTLKRMVLK